MKFLHLLLTFLLITFSSEGDTYALSACEIENDSTTKTTAKITCTVDSGSGIHGTTFVDNYLKINGNDTANKTSTATLGGCTAAATGTALTITCTTVTGATAGKYYNLTAITEAASSGVFTTTGQTGNGVTIATKDDSTKVYEGQASSENSNSNSNSSDGNNSGNFLKYTLVYLLLFLF
jgi:hypothetical protein